MLGGILEAGVTRGAAPLLALSASTFGEPDLFSPSKTVEVAGLKTFAEELRMFAEESSVVRTAGEEAITQPAAGLKDAVEVTRMLPRVLEGFG